MDQLTTEYEDLETSRSTTLEIIGRSSSERDWQAMLAYFLDPSESHDMGTTFLEAFVEVIADHPETTATGLTDHLDTVIVETEVSTPPSGYADLLIWAQEEWFICIEMKVEAEETGNQTERYATTPSLGPLVKASHEARGGESQYVYLAPHYASPRNRTTSLQKSRGVKLYLRLKDRFLPTMRIHRVRLSYPASSRPSKSISPWTNTIKSPKKHSSTPRTSLLWRAYNRHMMKKLFY